LNAHLIAGSALVGIYVAAIVIVATLASGSRRGTIGRSSLIGVRTKATKGGGTAWCDSQGKAQKSLTPLMSVLVLAAVAYSINAPVAGPFWVFLLIVAVSGAADAVVATSSVAAVNHAASRSS